MRLGSGGEEETSGREELSAAHASCLIQCSSAIKKHHDHGNSYKVKYLIGAGLEFIGLIHSHHSRKHDLVQADMMLE